MKIIGTIALVLLTAVTLSASGYNYVSPEELKNRIDSNSDILIVDIQVKAEFEQHHIPGSVATYAYPVKSDEDRARLETILTASRSDSTAIVIVCPRGAGGAKRTYEYLKQGGISESRLAILENGIAGWE